MENYSRKIVEYINKREKLKNTVIFLEKYTPKPISALFYIMLVDFVLGYKGWSLGVGMPVIVLTLDAIIIVCMIINMQNWESYLLLQIFCVILGAVQMALYFTKVLQSPVLPWTSFLVSLILFTSSVVIGDRKARNELKRKFYI